MQLIKDLQSEISAALENYSLPIEPVGLNEPIEYILSIGGKRIRPLLVLIANEMFRGDRSSALPPALALELFHNFTLMHDDIMDEAPLRRGKPTVHCMYDTNTAILSGDVMLIYAYQLLQGLDQSKFHRVFTSFNDSAVKVCEGQQFDMNFETKEKVEIDDYLKMIELKTAVLLGCSLQVGAIMGGATEEEDKKLYEFGRNIGIAFQIQDDILDVYGGNDFGKQTGGDIIQNKKTLLLLLAQQNANPTQASHLQKWIDVIDFDPDEKVQAVTALYNEIGVREMAEKEMEHYNNKAFSYLDGLDVISKEPLEYISAKLLKRVI